MFCTCVEREHMEDREFDLCMERMKKGDRTALKEIYEAYAGYIFHLIKNVLQNHENAEDVTSDFFIKLWDISDRYTPGGGHRAYLGRIAHNMAIDYLRAHKKEVLYDTRDGDEESGFDTLVDAQADAKDTTADTVIADISMEHMLSKLKPAEREVVHLKIVGEMTFEEISETLGQPMGTVTWRYREAVKKLRRCGFDA